MKNNITIADIAKDLNLSTSTISRAISGKGRISQETREKVLQYVDRKNYSPNIIAKSLVNSKTYNLLFTLPKKQNISEMPFFQNCLIGASETASKYFYDIIVVTQGEDDISNLKRIISNNKIDGVILTRVYENDIAIEYLKENNIPFVIIGESEDDTIAQIDSKHDKACYQVTVDVLSNRDNNNIKIGLIGGDMKNIVNKNRYKGFKKALKEVGILDKNLVSYLDVEENIHIGNIVEELLNQEVDYIFCMDDFICTKVLHKVDKKVNLGNKEIKIVSFYSNSTLENHYPPITQIKFDVRGLGITASLALIEKIAYENLATRRFLSYEIIN